jgi:hypothetical protein
MHRKKELHSFPGLTFWALGAVPSEPAGMGPKAPRNLVAMCGSVQGLRDDQLTRDGPNDMDQTCVVYANETLLDKEKVHTM